MGGYKKGGVEKGGWVIGFVRSRGDTRYVPRRGKGKGEVEGRWKEAGVMTSLFVSGDFHFSCRY